MKRIFPLFLAFFLFVGCAHTPTPDISPTTTQPITEPSTTEVAATEPVFDAYTLAASLSVEEQVGQLFLACCPAENALTDIGDYHLGGYILFGRDFRNETPQSITDKIAQYQSAADIPLLIAVDEEGGTVTRVSRYPQFRETPFPSPRKLFAQGGMPLILETEKEKSLLLSSLGINVNVSPVCDITTDPHSFMYSRSLGQNAETTCRYITGIVDIMQQNGIAGILKHFPGYGNNTDTHAGIALDDRELTELESCDLLPFAAGIQAGCGAIMVSHSFVNALDSDYPATLSPAVHSYLRENMGFSGVIITDDLSMQAITDLYGPREAAVLAVLAGNDLLCTTQYRVQYPAVLAAVRDGTIPQEMLTQAVARVLQWKYDMGLLTQ